MRRRQLAVPGVVDVKQVPNGVAVYAKGFWPAKTARDLLKITWNDSKAESRGTAQLLTEFRALSRSPGKTVKQEGDVDAAIAKGGRLIEAEVCVSLSGACPDGAAQRIHEMGRRHRLRAVRQSVPDA